MLLSRFIKQSVSALSELYPTDEARSMVLYYCSELFGLPSYIHITEPSIQVPQELLARAQSDIARLCNSEPLQYVLGYTEFCGRRFCLDERALIPRAETELLCSKAEELVAAGGTSADSGVVGGATGVSATGSVVGEPLRVLDLCTGSGCIAWTLALDLPGAIVTATDLSADALALARSQVFRVRKPAVKPTFVQADVLNVEASAAVLGGNKCQLLTANPPYVMVAEKADMRPNVLNWEPSMAIFAPENDPLLFHKAIAQIAHKVLAPQGVGIVEINSEIPDQTAAVFSDAGLSKVQIIQDFFDRPRFVSFTKE